MQNGPPLKRKRDDEAAQTPSLAKEARADLPVPAWLYYEVERSQEAVTAIANGNLHVNNFIQGLPEHWISGEAKILKAKKLILADSTIQNWAVYRRQALLNLLENQSRII